MDGRKAERWRKGKNKRLDGKEGKAGGEGAYGRDVKGEREHEREKKNRQGGGSEGGVRARMDR